MRKKELVRKFKKSTACMVVASMTLSQGIYINEKTAYAATQEGVGDQANGASADHGNSNGSGSERTEQEGSGIETGEPGQESSTTETGEAGQEGTTTGTGEVDKEGGEAGTGEVEQEGGEAGTGETDKGGSTTEEAGQEGSETEGSGQGSAETEGKDQGSNGAGAEDEGNGSLLEDQADEEVTQIEQEELEENKDFNFESFGEDLEISDPEIKVQTETKDDNYEGTEDQYAPGVDGAPDNFVSTNKTITYSVDIKFQSKSHKEYSFDDVRIVLLDHDGNEIIDSKMPIYRINNELDSGIVEDNQQFEVLNNTTAKAAAIQWGEQKFNSNGTVSMGVSFDIGDVTYWKTKLAPKFKVVCVKYMDGTEKIAESSVYSLPEVKLSSKGMFTTQVKGNGSILVNEAAKSVEIPFLVTSSKNAKTTINKLGDNPMFTTMQYQLHVDAACNDIDIAGLLTSDSFKLNMIKPSVDGMTVASEYNKETHILTITVTASDPEICRSVSTYDIEVLLSLADFQTEKAINEIKVAFRSLDGANGPVFTSDMSEERSYNEDLFEYTMNSYNVDIHNKIKLPWIDDAQEEGMPFVEDKISISNNRKGTFNHSVKLKTNQKVAWAGTKIYELLESELLRFTSDGLLVLQLEDGSTLSVGKDCYEVTYGYLPLPANYETDKDSINKWNTMKVLQQLQDGTLSLRAYQAEMDQTIKCYTLNDKFAAMLSEAGIADQAITINVVNSGYQRSVDGFANKLSPDLQIRDRGRLVSLVSMPITVEEKELDRTALAGKFAEIRNGHLNIGAQQYGKSVYAIERLGGISSPKCEIKVQDYNTTFELTLFKKDSSGNLVETDVVQEYSKTYYLRIGVADTASDTILPAGTSITIDLPENIRKLIKSIHSQPYMVMSGADGSIKRIDDFTINSTDQISMKLPCEIAVKGSDSKGGIYIPIQLETPLKDFTVKNIMYKIDQAMLDTEKSDIMNGISIDPEFYNTSYKNKSITLLHGNPDMNGMQVNESTDVYQYQWKDFVRFTGRIFNDTKGDYDYYMGLTVPTKSYYSKNSNDGIAYINYVKPDSQCTTLYYMREQDAAPEDIAAVTNPENKQNLKTYYADVIMEGKKWTKWTGDGELPSDVVMIVGYWEKLPSGEMAKIDYHVQMNFAGVTAGDYENYSIMKYYSGNTKKEVYSNDVIIKTTITEETEGGKPEEPESSDPEKPEGSNPDNGSNPGTPTPISPSNPNDSADIMVEDEEVPLADGADKEEVQIDEADTPLTKPGSIEDETIIEDEDTPLVNPVKANSDKRRMVKKSATQEKITKTQKDKDVTMDDGEAPLANLPKTGQQRTTAMAMAAVTSVVALGALAFIELMRRRRD